MYPRRIALGGVHDVVAEAGRAADAQDQYAGRQRVKGAGVPNFLDAGSAAHLRYDVVAGDAERLVDVQEAKQRKLRFWLCVPAMLVGLCRRGNGEIPARAECASLERSTGEVYVSTLYGLSRAILSDG
jgi:hypothetical protein